METVHSHMLGFPNLLRVNFEMSFAVGTDWGPAPVISPFWTDLISHFNLVLTDFWRAMHLLGFGYKNSTKQDRN